MNIKIATFFFGNNYGALLQAYYLKKFINEKFIEKKIDFFKYQPKKFIFVDASIAIKNRFVMEHTIG